MRKCTRIAAGLAGIACALATGQASAQLNDSFDSYAPGSGLAGQGGWELWYSGGVDATVSNAQASSGENSLRLTVLSDVVYQFSGISDGQWVYRAMTYMPSASVGDAYLIVMNGYGGATLDNWSIQVRFGGDDDTVASEFGGELATLLPDQWVEFRAEIDLDATFGSFGVVGLMNLYYNDVLFAEELIWIDNASTGGTTDIAATDLFSLDCDEFFIDDVSLTPAGGCPAEYNGNPDDGDILDLLDFIDDFSSCEQNPAPCGTFGDPDINGDTFIDILDFLDFIDAFSFGCP